MANEFIIIEESLTELDELFSEDFMREYTHFNNFRELTYSGAVFVNWQAKPIIAEKKAFDWCVKGKTHFETWTDMYLAAKAFQQSKAV